MSKEEKEKKEKEEQKKLLEEWMEGIKKGDDDKSQRFEMPRD